MITQQYLINVITKPEVAGHLIPNIKGFDIIYYIKVECKGAGSKDLEEISMVKVQILCTPDMSSKIWDYIEEYYVKGYGAILYYEQVRVPM